MLDNRKKDIRDALLQDEPPQLEGGSLTGSQYMDDGIPATQFLSAYNMHMWKMKQHREQGTFFVHGSYKRFSTRSLKVLDSKNEFRYKVVWIVTSKFFERFIITLILIYSVLLGMKDYTDYDNLTPVNQFIEQIDPYFNVIVYAEFVLKTIAMGFAFDSGSYLDDGWNWIDFFVVASSAAQQLMSALNLNQGGGKALSALRAFRLLRPLKLLTSIPSLKLLLGTLINSVQSLGGIMGLAIFFFTIFSILGVAIWAGKIHYRCYTTPFPTEDGEWELTPDFDYLCSESHNQCPTGNYCRSRFEVYNPDGSPFVFKNPNLWIDTQFSAFNYGMTQFDDIVSAFLTIFICTTMDGWTKIMYLHTDIYSPGFVHFYFITVVWICSFFILNLTIASMLMKYAEVDKEQEESGESAPDQFELELKEIGKSIFEVKHMAIVDFIVEQDSIQIDDGAKKHLKKDMSFIQKFFQKKNYVLDEPDSPYYKHPIVAKCMDIISHPLFDGLIMCVIILNTISLAMDKEPQFDQWVLEFLSYLNLLFTVIFTLEIVFKMTALGVKEFSKEGFNLFDLAIVITSLSQIFFKQKGKHKGGGIFLIFRTFRVFRIFKLFKIGDMRMLLDSIIFTVSTIGPYVVFLLFFIYIFALVGMSFYAGKIKFNDEGHVDPNGNSPRENFDSLGNTVLTLFIIIMGSGWSDIMIQTIRCIGPIAAVYFVLMFVVGGIVLLNLFLAIMLGNFDKAKFFGQKKKVLEAFKELMHGQDGKQYSIIDACDVVLGDLSTHVIDEVLKVKRPSLNLNKLSILAKGQNIKTLNMFQGMNFAKPVGSSRNVAVNMLDASSARSFGSGFHKKIDDPQNPMDLDDIQSEVSDMLFADDYLTNSSLYIFHLDMKIRRFCLLLAEPRNLVDEVYRKRDLLPDNMASKRLIIIDDDDSDDPDVIAKREVLRAERQKSYNWVNKNFDLVVLVLIMISSLMLPLDNPLNDPDSKQTQMIMYINVVFTLCFITEASTKIIAKGMISNNLGEIKPYLDSGWNRVDAFVVSISALDLILMMSGQGSQFAALKALRALRALRPLRVIKRFENLRIIVNALFATFGAMQNVLMVGTLLLLIFSIMGVSFFKGTFFHCHFPQGVEVVKVVTKEDCLAADAEWRNSNMNFDNAMSAMNSLFLMMQGEGWTDTMYKAMDSTGIGLEPITNNKAYFLSFFVAYMIVGALFISNLFVGVVIDNFNKIKEKNELGSAFVTDNQRQWILMQQIGQRLSMRKKTMEPDGFRKYFFRIVHHTVFDNFITTMVVLNTLCMAVIRYKMNPQAKYTLKVLNYIFSFVFNMEMFLKLIAVKGDYFNSNWNLFDMFIVVSADIGIVLDLAGLNKNMSTAVTILRAFRIMRIVKLLQKFDSIRVIIYAVINILPSIANVMSLFILALFIFACVGINLFSGAKYIEFIDDKNNFQTFGNSMLLLMRFSTGEGWSDFMYEYANQEDCVFTQSYQDIQDFGFQGCGTSLSFIFFISFTVIAAMLILNLAIAAVIDGLQAAQADNDRLFKNDDIDIFMDTWAFYDPKGKGMMSIENILFFIVDLEPPFGQHSHLRIPIREGMDFDHYLINMPKGYVIQRREMFKVIKFYKLKAVKGTCGHYHVMFHDVYKEFIKKAFEYHKVNKFKVNSKKVKDKLKKGWKKKGEVEAEDNVIQRQLAATTIQRRFLRRLNERKVARLAKSMELDEK